ncbi:hypothetical protein ACH5RR_025990 [Cinchona calisaya]|uniref:Uncharacterized protein n=1 Tax=Cinchona calisaya TaxID=153742 RepID=A0ABD2Z685_9GENT
MGRVNLVESSRKVLSLLGTVDDMYEDDGGGRKGKMGKEGEGRKGKVGKERGDTDIKVFVSLIVPVFLGFMRLNSFPMLIAFASFVVYMKLELTFW